VTIFNDKRNDFPFCRIFVGAIEKSRLYRGCHNLWRDDFLKLRILPNLRGKARLDRMNEKQERKAQESGAWESGRVFFNFSEKRQRGMRHSIVLYFT
jgi:hypothetical protein